MKPLNVAVMGATGVVGREVLAGLQEAGHPSSQVTALASERSSGEEVEYLDDSLEVETASEDALRGMGLVLLATPAEVSKRFAPTAQALGAWVVDTSTAYEGEPSVPLFLPGVHEPSPDVAMHGRIARVPSATTTAVALALEPLRRAFGLVEVQATVLLGASHAGQRGIRAFELETTGLLSGREPEELVPAFPHRLAFNLIPQVGDFEGEAHAGWTTEERRLRAELSTLWGDGMPKSFTATAVHAPMFYGTMATLSVRLRKGATAAEVKAALAAASHVKLLDVPAEKVYPMPMLVTADPTVHVGRVRISPEEPERVTLVAAVDNAGRGSALNAVEVGLALVRRSE